MSLLGSLTSVDAFDWVKALSDIRLNNVHKNRSCELLLLAEKTLISSVHLRMIERWSQNDQEHYLYFITINDVYNLVEECYAPRVYIDQSIQKIIQAACREAARYLQMCEPIPIDFLVKLIKLKIILIIKQDASQESATLRQRNNIFESPPAVAARGTGKANDKKSKSKGSKELKKSEIKGKEKRVVEEDICLPYLMQRPTKMFASDSVDIPEKVIYIVLMDFYMVEIFEYLFSEDMALRCVIEFNEKSALHIRNSFYKEGPVNIFAHNHYTSRQFRSKRDALLLFWSNLYNIFIHNKREHLRESFIMSYTPIIIIESENHQEVDQLAYSRKLFQHFAQAVQKINDFRMCHRNYLDKLRIHSLGETPVVVPVHCMGIYNASINTLPIECVGVEILLEYLLTEVCHRADVSTPSLREGTLSQRHLAIENVKLIDQKVEFSQTVGDFRDHLKEIFGYLKMRNFTNVNRIPMKEYEMLPSVKYTLKNECYVTHERNFLERSLYAYKNLHKSIFNICEKYLKMNVHMKLWNQYSATDDTAEFNKQLTELSSMMDMDCKNLLSCIIVLLFGKVSCFSHSQAASKPWEMETHFPVRCNVLQMNPPEPEIIDSGDAVIPHNLYNTYEQLPLHEFTWIEDLSSVVLLQELRKMLDEYECVDHLYLPFCDSLQLRLHHKSDIFGIATNKWMARIRSRVDLNDFLTFVIHEDKKFLMEEEQRCTELNQLYREIIEREQRRINQFEIRSEDFILKGSLKDKERKGSLQIEVEPKKEAKKEKGSKFLSTKTGNPTSTKKSISRGSSKPVVPDLRSIVDGGKIHIEIDIQDVQNAVAVKFPLPYLDAYDLPERVAFSGSTTAFYSLDQMKVIVDRYVQTGRPPRLSVMLEMSGHNMILHTYVQEGFVFHYQLKSGGMVVFGKQSQTQSNHRMKKLEDVYLLNEKRIHAIKCFGTNMVLKRKLLITSQYLKQIIDMSSGRRQHDAINYSHASGKFTSSSIINSENFKSEKTEGRINRKQFLRELRQLKASTSIFNFHFKICSSRLHKYSHVKRITSPILLELRQMQKLVNCEDYYGLSKLVQIKNCFPIPDKSNILENFPKYDVRITLQNGLHVRNIPGIAPSNSYINQFFFKKGPQHVKIVSEESRTFLPCGFVVVKHIDGTMTLYGGNGRIIKFDIPLLRKQRKNLNRSFMQKISQNEHLHKLVSTLRRKLNRYSKYARGGRDSQFAKSRKAYSCTTKKIQYNSQVAMLTMSDNDLNFTLSTTDGKQIKFKKGKIVENDCYYVSKEDKIRSNKFVYHREDGTVIILTSEGCIQTTYLDGTRVTAWFEVSTDHVTVDLSHLFGTDTENMGVWIVIHMCYQFEHPNYATVTYCKNTTKLQMPDRTIMECNNDAYLLKMDDSVIATIKTDGIEIASSPCPGCKKKCCCTFNIKQLYQLQNHISGHEILLTAMDTYDKTFIVNYDGTCKRNDNYNDVNCDHILHKTQNSQAFFVMKRDGSGHLMWTNRMYKERLLESELEPNQTAFVYADKENSEKQTLQFRAYNKEEHWDKFTMSYSPILNAYYKEPTFDFSTATLVTHRLLRSIPSFKAAAPLYMALINHLLQHNIKSAIDSNYCSLLSNSDVLSPKMEKTAAQRKNLYKIFRKKITEWKLQCEIGHQEIIEFNSKPLTYYNFDVMKVPTNSQTRACLSEDKSSNIGLEESLLTVTNYRSLGTNTSMPYCADTEQEDKLKKADSSSLASLIGLLETNGQERSQEISTMLKCKLVENISNILTCTYHVNVDEENIEEDAASQYLFTGSNVHALEKQAEISKSDSDEEAESETSSIPDYFKSENYRAAYRLFTNLPTTRSNIDMQHVYVSALDAPVSNNEDLESNSTNEDFWFNPIPNKQTLSLQVLNSKILQQHQNCSNAELILKDQSSEKQPRKMTDDMREQSIGICKGKTSNALHCCRLCLEVPFVRQTAYLYESKNYLDLEENEGNAQIIERNSPR